MVVERFDECRIRNGRCKPKEVFLAGPPGYEPITIAVDDRSVQVDPEGGCFRDITKNKFRLAPRGRILRNPYLVPTSAGIGNVVAPFKRGAMGLEVCTAAWISGKIDRASLTMLALVWVEDGERILGCARFET